MAKGFGVMIQVKGKRIIILKIEDDDGIIHLINIKKALYVPELPSCLLSPKQWKHQANGNYPNPDGTCVPTRPATVLYIGTGTLPPYHHLVSFSQCHHNPLRSIIKLLQSIFCSLQRRASAGRHRSCMLCIHSIRWWRQIWIKEKQKYITEGPKTFFKPISHDGNLQTTNAREENIHNLVSPGTHLLTQSPVNYILTNIEEEGMSSDSQQAELLRWHYCLGYCLFTRLRLLAALGILTRKLLKVKPPKCTKSTNNQGSIWKLSTPGECIILSDGV